jgi:dsRNA-specific ribonuclease
MGYHNDTCGCPKCFHINYPHRANPHGVDYTQSASPNYSPSPNHSPPQPHDPVSQAIDFINNYGTTEESPNPETLAASFEALIVAIDASAATAKQKQEVKGLLEELMEQPTATKALGELADQLRKLLGK